MASKSGQVTLRKEIIRRLDEIRKKEKTSYSGAIEQLFSSVNVLESKIKINRVGELKWK